MTTEVIGKSLALLKEAVPNAFPMAVLWNPNNVTYQGQYCTRQRSRPGNWVFNSRPSGCEVSKSSIARSQRSPMGGAATLLVLPDPVFSAYTARIADLANIGKLPAMYGLREDAAAGGLMAYCPTYADLYRRAASYVDKILKGAKPADLPVEQPTKLEFIINLKTAKALGLTFPPGVLAIADEVIV
jgi:putative ABC transport system substrate-binding protein